MKNVKKEKKINFFVFNSYSLIYNIPRPANMQGARAVSIMIHHTAKVKSDPGNCKCIEEAKITSALFN